MGLFIIPEFIQETLGWAEYTWRVAKQLWHKVGWSGWSRTEQLKSILEIKFTEFCGLSQRWGYNLPRGSGWLEPPPLLAAGPHWCPQSCL